MNVSGQFFYLLTFITSLKLCIVTFQYLILFETNFGKDIIKLALIAKKK